MDVLPVEGYDERRVRAARRFGRIGLVMTVVTLLLAPAMHLWLPARGPGWTGAVLGLYVVALGLHLWRIREHVRWLGRPAPTWFVLAAAVVGLAIALVGLAASPVGFVWSVVTAILVGDIVGGRGWRWILVWVVLTTGAVLGGGLLVTHWWGFGPELPGWLGPAIGAFYVSSIWMVDVERLWWLKSVTDLDGSRRVAAELATARERLRLADDLHDILGHALEVVAFKSELAGRLLAADAERARSELDDVQRVARESLDEVRSLVRDARATDLAAELAGARAVLTSAGVALEVRGDPATIPPAARNVLGRVLREAMTNVLRHSEPSRCTIEIDVTGGDARLAVVNDGVVSADGSGDGSGTGLTALRRYLDEHAGRLDAGPGPDGTFSLAAVLPGVR